MTPLGHMPSLAAAGSGGCMFQSQEWWWGGRLTPGAGGAREAGIQAAGVGHELPFTALDTRALGVGASAGFTNILACARGWELWSDTTPGHTWRPPTGPWGLASPMGRNTHVLECGSK